MRPHDRWSELPEIVEQLQAEASRGPQVRPSVAPKPASAREAPRGAKAPGSVERDEDDTLIRIGEVPANGIVEFPEEAPRTPAPRSARAAPATPVVGSAARNGRQQRSTAATAEGSLATARRAPTEPAIDWGGLDDYDQLAADPRPDPRALHQRLLDELEHVLDAHDESTRLMARHLGTLIGALSHDDPAAETSEHQLATVLEWIDRFEEVLATQLVKR
jgi:hypothetical protein